jgi:hypothetical protein
MNRHITRILLASATFAVSSIINIASGQVLGGGGDLTGSLGGSLHNATGTLNGAGSFGGAFDTAPVAGRAHGVLDRTGGLARDSGRKMRDRARSTTNAVKSEAQGATNDVTGSATDVSTLVKEEPEALANDAVASADATIEGSGSFNAGATTDDLTKAEALEGPSTGTDAENSTGSSSSSLVPALSGSDTSAGETTTAPAPAPHANPLVSGRAGARGDGEAQVQM